MVQAQVPQQLRQPKIIERPRLTRQLDECGARTILLVAPAGYGKTTLARQWLADKPHAWCALTPACRDVAALALSIATAARAIIPDAGKRMQTRLGLSQRPSEEIDVFVEMLAGDLAQWPDAAWLALDDYQAVAGAADCETFIEGLMEAAPIRVLASSRSHPRWATSRSRAYGAHFEIERQDLTMTEEEAAQVAPPSAVALAEGWPAVVGLAASLETVQPRTQLADSTALHSFLAEELLKKAPPKVQRSLFRLSLCPDLSLEQARAILGAGRVASLVERSERLGLLTVRDGNIAMHPLLRQFITQWHHARDPNWRADANAVCRALIHQRHWDAAFALIRELHDDELFDELLSKGLTPMLQAGRHKTVESWVAHAKGKPSARSPWLLFAEAEVTSRRGDQNRAQALSVQAARVAQDDSLAVRAWNLAGRTAHLLDRYDEAFEHHSRAEALAGTASERYDALWGEIVASWQVDPDRAGDLIKPLTECADSSIDAQLRLASVEVQHGLRRGSIGDLENLIRERVILAARADNPVVASSYLTIAARWFAMTGSYDDALRVSDETVALARQHRLSFVLPTVLNVRAMSLIGLRKWGEAGRALSAADAHAQEFDDVHNQVDAHAIRMRLDLARGETARALDATNAEWARRPGPIEMLEYQATCELVRAVAGEDELAAAESRASMPPTADTLTLILAAKAIRSLRSGRPSRAAIASLCSHVLRSSCVDGFVIAYRGCPELLNQAVLDERFRDYACTILPAARDSHLAGRAGLRVTQVERTALTRREKEVHELLAQGLTNREIARLLYVEEVTVKVHVRHILDKLGVRSRVEAATKFSG
jgi:DNA-binding CsgD family transcriptional regulator/tetratricopeptide (TPR) repeat protein